MKASITKKAVPKVLEVLATATCTGKIEDQEKL